MKIDKEQIKSIAAMSNIILDNNQEKNMIKDLNQISDWIEKISEINTENCSPILSMSKEKNILKNDNANNANSQKSILVNAPEKDSNYFRIPSVIKK